MAYSTGRKKDSYLNICQRWVLFNERGEGSDRSERQEEKKARISFVQRDFYSYDTIVASYHDEGRYVLATNHNYSLTTNGHLSMVRQNVKVAVFTVPTISWHADHLANVRYLWDQLGVVGDQATKRWRSNVEEMTWQGALLRAHEQCSSYVEHTGVKFTLTPLDIMMDAIKEDIEDRRRAWEHPNAITRRERAAARRLAMNVLTPQEKGAEA